MRVSRAVKADAGFVSLANVKNTARRLLPPTSTARSIILAESDLVPLQEAIAKFEVFDRLLSKELAS